MKNTTSGWRLTKAVMVLMVVSQPRLQWHDHGRDHETDEGYCRSQPADHVGTEVAVARFPPVLRGLIGLPAHKNAVNRLGNKARGEDGAAPERDEDRSNQHEHGTPRAL